MGLQTIEIIAFENKYYRMTNYYKCDKQEALLAKNNSVPRNEIEESATIWTRAYNE